MASRNEHRAQKRAEKQRMKAKAEHKARRTARHVPAVTDQGARAAAWSLGPSWASEGWYDQGAHVHAVFTRRRPDGRSNVAVFEVDLAERGVIAAKVMSDLTDDRLLAEVGRRSGDKAMLEVEPDVVARIVHDGRAWGTSRGHAQPKDLDQVLALLGDVKGLDTDPVKCGPPEGSAAAYVPPKGAWARFQRWLFGDPVRPTR